MKILLFLENGKAFEFKEVQDFDNAWVGYNPDRLQELEKGNKYD